MGSYERFRQGDTIATYLFYEKKDGSERIGYNLRVDQIIDTSWETRSREDLRRM